MKLSTKLILLYLVTVLGVTLPVGMLFYQNAVYTAEKQITNNLQERATHTLDKIDRFLFERFADVQVVAKDTLFHKESTPLELTNRLLDYRNYYQVYLSLSFYNAQKIKVVDTDGWSIGQPASHDHRWVQEVFDEGHVSAASEVGYAENSGQPVMYFAAPVKNQTGQIIGAIVAQLAAERIYDILIELKAMTQKGQVGIELLDATGRVLYSNHEHEIKRPEKVITIEQFIKTFHQDDFYTLALEQGFLDFKGNQWTLLVYYPIEEVFAPILALKNQAMISTFIFLIVALIGILAFAHTVVNPIVLLQAAAIKVKKGYSNVKIPSTSKDEIGQLTDSFNQMIQMLNDNLNECQEMERALLESHEQLREIIEGTDDLIVRIDADFHLIYVNSVAEKFFGLKPEECLGLPIFDFIHPEDRGFTQTTFAQWRCVQPNDKAKFASHSQALFKNDEVELRSSPLPNKIGEQETCSLNETLENRIINRRSGKIYNMLWNVHLHHNGQEQIIRFNAIGRDITAMKQTNAALRESEERFRAIFESTSDCVLVWSQDYVHLYANQAAIDYVHKTRDEVVGKTLLEVLKELPDFGRLWMDRIDRCFAEGTSFRVEDVVKMGGLPVYSESIVSPVKDAQGKVLATTLVYRDVTERKHAETAYQQSEKRFRRLYEALRDGVATTDLQGNILEFNPTFQQIIGYEAEEIYKLSYREVTPAKWYKTELTIIKEQVIPKGYSSLYEKEYIRKDGMIVPIEIRTYLQRDEAGNPAYYWAVIRDISERKKVELALQQAKEAAETANQAKSSFLANMSHELRTPLNGILGYAQILSRDKELNDKQQEGISIIQSSGEYLLTLINDILDLSKIEAGKIELYDVDFNFHELLRNLTELFQVRAQQKGIAFIYKPLSHIPLGVHGDDKRLRQILINLLGNAVKFTERGGVTLKVEYSSGEIRFHIEDTGIGIASEDIERIFQPFQQVGHFMQKAEGTGLGLPITQKLVDMMGGILLVESTPNHGSIFSVILNLPDVSAMVRRKSELDSVIIGFQGPPRTILVVDDRWENRSVMINLLTPLGFHVVEATNGKEGVEKACESHPDLVLMDLVMPIMDGFEASRHLRKIPELEKVPIIAASASIVDHQEKSIAVGCNDFIPKPFRATVLLDIIQKYLNLTWIYEQEAVEPISVEIPLSGIHESEDVFMGPSPEQASELLDLAMMGDIGAILRKLEILEAEDAQLLPFIIKVRQLSKNFEEEQICRLVEQYIVVPL